MASEYKKNIQINYLYNTQELRIHFYSLKPVFLKFNLELIQFELIHESIQKNVESESNRFIL